MYFTKCYLYTLSANLNKKILFFDEFDYLRNCEKYFTKNLSVALTDLLTKRVFCATLLL